MSNSQTKTPDPFLSHRFATFPSFVIKPVRRGSRVTLSVLDAPVSNSRATEAMVGASALSNLNLRVDRF
jgi:hypothetical protein